VGLVSDDIYFDRDPKSIWYGEQRPLGNIPIGIRDYNMRLITTVTTSENAVYEALLPSLEMYNCPIPQGPCPGMYVVVVNDPGDKAHPNPTYNPNYLTASFRRIPVAPQPARLHRRGGAIIENDASWRRRVLCRVCRRHQRLQR
jgi:hypothetical protein